MAGDAGTQQLHAVAGEVEQQSCIVLAEQGFQGVLLAAVADDGLAAVAPGRTPADPLRLQHHHPITGLGQGQRRTQPGIAGAEDAHVGAYLAS
ncbi:hypothetical protein NB689_001036 [Xanthomonas sacchari]|nr:hypothetical protein [Xanthomonas sacchari]